MSHQAGEGISTTQCTREGPSIKIHQTLWSGSGPSFSLRESEATFHCFVESMPISESGLERKCIMVINPFSMNCHFTCFDSVVVWANIDSFIYI